jgi:two-component system nitrate/nitrite response regulator NarL
MNERVEISEETAVFPTMTTAEPIRLLIVARLHLYSRVLAQFLSTLRNLRVVGVTENVVEALDSVDGCGPDIVLIDMRMSNSAVAVRRIAAADRTIKIIVFEVPSDDHDLAACARARVAGYVGPGEGPEELVVTIKSVARGELRCSPRIAGPLLDRVAALATEDSSDRVDISLTAREREVLELIDRGHSNKEIALALSIELPTVKNHVHNIFAKLKVNRRTEAVACLRR